MACHPDPNHIYFLQCVYGFDSQHLASQQSKIRWIQVTLFVIFSLRLFITFPFGITTFLLQIPKTKAIMEELSIKHTLLKLGYTNSAID